MNSKQSSQPTPFGTSIHRLEGKALRQWWQMSSSRSIGDTTNHGIRVLLITLVTLPFTIILGLRFWTASIRDAYIFLGIASWLSCFLMFLSIARRHLYHVLEVRASEEGLEFRSLLFKRKIRWLDIADFFPTGNAEIASNEFVLECRSGEEFLISKEVTDSSRLFELIIQRMPRPTVSYEVNYRTQDGYIDIFIAMCFAIGLAFIFPVLRALLLAAPLSIGELLISVSGVALALVLWRFQMTKMPQLIRAGPSGLFVRTRCQSKVIPWQQITNIRQIGRYFILRSVLGWFVMLLDKTGPMSEKLLECKRNLPSNIIQ